MKNLIKTGITTTPTNETSGTSFVQLQHNEFENPSQIPIFQQFGFVSSPPNGSGVLTLDIGGDASNKAVIATHNASLRYVNLPAGSTAVHNASRDSISLINGIVTFMIGGVVVATCDNQGFHVTGKITATSDIHSTGGNVISGNGVELEGHTHTSETAGTQTSGPIN